MANRFHNEQVANDRSAENISYKGKIQSNGSPTNNYLGKLKEGSGSIGLSGKSHGKDVNVSGQKRGL